ncbi:MAG TPA: hypothetical protein VGF45_07930, partial [Polyangia bacterium]
IEHTVAADGTLLVRRGLSPEDQVVVSPWPEAQEGQAVTIAPAKSAQIGAEGAANPAQTAVLEPLGEKKSGGEVRPAPKAPAGANQ